MMNQECTGSYAPMFRRLMRMIVIPGAVLVLAGCSGYEKLPQQSFDEDYKVFSVTSGKSGSLNVFFIKAFESDGKVGMCGGYTRGESSFGKQGSRYWADISKVKIGDTQIGSAEFMNEMPLYGFRGSQDFEDFSERLLESTPTTNCVRSDVPWRAEFESMEIERTGPNKVRIYD